MLLTMEEIDENCPLLLKIEKELNHEFRNKLYMYFFTYAKYVPLYTIQLTTHFSFESLLHIMRRQKESHIVDQGSDMIE